MHLSRLNGIDKTTNAIKVCSLAKDRYFSHTTKNICLLNYYRNCFLKTNYFITMSSLKILVGELPIIQQDLDKQ